MSVIEEFKADVAVASPMEEVCGFFQTAQNLVTMTPPDQKVRIGAGGETPLHAGLEVRISVSPIPGVRTGWLTRIEEVQPPGAVGGSAWFRDTQLKGPFAVWNHRHDFEIIEGGCRVVDTLRYALPLGRLGHAVAGKWVWKQMEDLFAFRSAQMHARFGKIQ